MQICTFQQVRTYFKTILQLFTMKIQYFLHASVVLLPIGETRISIEKCCNICDEKAIVCLFFFFMFNIYWNFVSVYWINFWKISLGFKKVFTNSGNK